MTAYRTALGRLAARGLVYPCRCRRGDIRAALSAPQEGAPMAAPVGPDGLVYPGTCRGRDMAGAGPEDAIRLDMRRALAALGDLSRIGFRETGLRPGWQGTDAAQLTERVGDVVLARRDIGTSYHLAVVTDDAAQGITEVVRGADLFEATGLHVILQNLLEVPVPAYHHHRLIRDDHGKRLAKRDDARAIATYRAEGASPRDIRAMLGLL